ncbi:MAG: SMC-Scp complex subunit ScpB [Chlorobi bacterium]|nr:SMC-Scp complex subunit ScpB [Chlorobiota bacterium]
MKLPFSLPFEDLSRQRQCRIVEAIIFASDQPVMLEQFRAALDIANPEQLAELIGDRITEINAELEATDRPYRIVSIAGGWQFSTLPDYGAMVAEFFQRKEQRRFSRAALEVLAIIAYKQPVTKSEIDAIRGVNSAETIATLLERNLITIAGRSASLGKPLLYATTEQFLQTFGLGSLADLPKPREIDELFRSRAEEFARQMNQVPTGGARRMLDVLDQFLRPATDAPHPDSEPSADNHT